MRALVAALALLGACAAPQAETPAPPSSTPRNAEEATEADTCGASRFRHLIGAPAAEIDRATLPPRTRIITPDTMVTMDFSAERLNIMVGTDGRVGSMRCF
ncbi:MAG: I78 family peptidase inhibitor [Hyphomonadaceae bacterium]